MSELVFYTNPMSRGRIARWMLEEVVAKTAMSYDTEVVDYGPAMKSPEYLAINPMGKVPAIKSGNTVVTETAAICAWLADAYPGAGLASDAANKGDYYRWMFYAAGPVEAAVTNNSMGFEAPADKQGMLGYGSFDQVMDTLESALTDREYIAGDTFSAADVYLGSQIGWGLQFGSMDKRPAFETYFARISDRDAWRRANELDDALMPDT